MNIQQEKQESALPLKKLPSESERQFELRVEVLNKAKISGLSEQRAVMLANIFYNMFYLGSSYPAAIEQEVIEYWPDAPQTIQKDKSPRLYFKS